MGEVVTHLRVVYGYYVGGPSDDWRGITNPQRDCGWPYTWKMPDVPWLDEAALEENHPDHFQACAEELLKQAELHETEIEVVVMDDEDGDWFYVIAVPVDSISPYSGRLPMVLNKSDFSAAVKFDSTLRRAMDVLGLTPTQSSPDWIIGTIDA